ncbi:hydrogenase [bacterium (Candidatus Torokbacteria) CG09_land_8_20_14_0_10_42_11]|nr:MAG: hydrogenase [bacterium (Candidatus Torokbacteria) CG09_land_8_20_14_0_10_42_11]
MKNKKTLLITSLTSCNGCLFTILDLGQKFFDLLSRFKLLGFHLIEDEDKNESNKIDIALVEGTVATQAEKRKLLALREKTKFLIALGACSHLGNIQKLKNYGNKEEILKKVYSNASRIENLEIKPLSAYVAVDFIIPGCPPNKNEILEILRQLAINRKPYLPDRPVCYECQIKGYPCLLQKGKPCLGPIIRGGCEAICLKGNFPCTGCRGATSEPNTKKMQELLGHKEYARILEIFGNK